MTDCETPPLHPILFSLWGRNLHFCSRPCILQQHLPVGESTFPPALAACSLQPVVVRRDASQVWADMSRITGFITSLALLYHENDVPDKGCSLLPKTQKAENMKQSWSVLNRATANTQYEHGNRVYHNKSMMFGDYLLLQYNLENSDQQNDLLPTRPWRP